MKWNIVTDSSCDLIPVGNQNDKVQISNVPFIISIGNKEFVDNETANIDVMLDEMERCKEASHTSCPSPQSWVEQFEKAEQCIAITISSKLSGSMNSAMIAKEIVLEQYPDKQIAVLDSRSTGPELVLCVEEILCQIEEGKNFESIVSHANEFLQRTKVMFALSSFDNLVKNGRMNKVAGFIAKKLGMWGIGIGSEEGAIVVKGKARGAIKALSMLLENMKENGFCGGRVVISHCQNPALAEKLQNKIQEIWADSNVSILSTRGLCSYYTERGGLIISY